METNLVDRPVRHATHIPLLIKTFEISRGDVLELGTGYYSTPLLLWLCQMERRNLYSYESDDFWYQKLSNKNEKYHKLYKVDNFDKIDIERHWGMVFIDHAPAGRRRVDIARLANWAEYIVVHDTNESEDRYYRYSKIWSLFKYRYDYTRLSPFTSVVSNFHDLKEFK